MGTKISQLPLGSVSIANDEFEINQGGVSKKILQSTLEAKIVAAVPIPPAQVPSDWNATSGPSFIQNKPIIPTNNWKTDASNSGTLNSLAFGTVAGTGNINFKVNGNPYGFWKDTDIAMGVNSNAGVASLAIGGNSSAPNVYATAIGYDAKTTSDQATALGANSKALGLYSMSLGYGSKATGQVSTALGFGADSLGQNSIAFGYNTTSPGIYSTAVGSISLSLSDYGVSLGYTAKSIGTQSTSIGSYSQGIGFNSTALGYGAVATGTNSMALGFNSAAPSNNFIRIGDANITSIEGQVNMTIPSDKRFKDNVINHPLGLVFIDKLQPVDYNFNSFKYQQHINPDSIWDYTKTDLQNEGKFKEIDFIVTNSVKHTGLLAQDVKEAALNSGNNTFLGVKESEGTNSTFSMAYSELVMPLINAVKELKAQIKALKDNNGLI